MHQVLPPISIVQKILGEQKTDEGASYRLTAHCLRAGRPEGALLYHTLTGELLLLSPEEPAGLEELPGLDTRPTTSRVKEGLFSAIQFDIEGRR